MKFRPLSLVRTVRELNKSGSRLSLRELITPYTVGLRSKLAIMSVTAIVGGFAEALLLLIIARVAFALTTDATHVVVSYGPVQDLRISIPTLFALASAMIVLRVALQITQNVLGTQTASIVVNRTRRRFINLFLAVDWPTQAKQQEGRLQQLLMGFAGAAAVSVSALVQAVTSALTLTGLLITALLVSPAASIGAALAALLIGFVLKPLRAAVRRRSARLAASGLEFGTGVTELSAALQEVRIFGVADQVESDLGAVSDEIMRRERSTGYLGGSIIIFYQGIAMILILATLGLAYAVNFSRVAALGAVVLMMVRSLSYAQAVQAQLQSLQTQAPYLETLHAEEQQFVGAALPVGGARVDHIGEIAFEHVTFEYEPGVPVLRDVSFRAKPGEIVGIVGPSGAGKSTLVQILLRLREPTSGRLLVDGRDAGELAYDSWYEHLSFVPQDARLRSGTVADNIRFFRQDVDDAAIQRAAKLADVHDDIMSWALGYDTPVGSRGNQLSGGQKQRVSIARALVEEPDVVVLDEPTSALDVKSEGLIRETMSELAPRTTVFIIAHRLSTLSICDRIMVILGGELQGFDDPVTLEATNPFYRDALEHSGMR